MRRPATALCILAALAILPAPSSAGVTVVPIATSPRSGDEDVARPLTTHGDVEPAALIRTLVARARRSAERMRGDLRPGEAATGGARSGRPARSDEAAPFPTSIYPAGDLDGDGAADLVEQLVGRSDVPYPCQTSDRWRSTFQARKGTTGSILWSRSIEGLFSFSVPARLGAAGTPGVLIVSYEVVECRPLTAQTVLRLTVEAIDGSGAEHWSRTWTGWSMLGLEVGLPFAGLVLAAEPRRADAVLVWLTSTSYSSDLEYIEQAEYLVVDGRDGSLHSSATVAQPSLPPQPQLAGDLDGDEFDDYLVVTDYCCQGDAPRYVEARRSSDGTRLWRRDDLPMDGISDWILPVGDRTGDGGADLVFNDAFSPYVSGDDGLLTDSGNEIHLVDGSDGRSAWSRAGNVAQPTGDVDGDGIDDVAMLTEIREAAVAGIRYEVVTSSGTVGVAGAWTHAVPPDTDDTRWWTHARWVGDVEPDGFADIAVEWSETSPGPYPRSEHTIVSGRDGRSRYVLSGALQPLRASLDGEGDDVRVVPGCLCDGTHVLDGRTGLELWDGPVRANFWWENTADVTGDGRADAIGWLWDSSDMRAAVLDGNDGSVAWGS